MKDTLKEVAGLINRPVADKMGLTPYIGELCSQVSSCSLFVEFIAKDEQRYQRLLHVC